MAITRAGHEFLDGGKPAVTFARQVQKFQFWNPAVGSKIHQSIQLHPLTYLLEVLVQLDSLAITATEYILFCAKAKAYGDVEDTVDAIRRWRLLGNLRRKGLTEEIDAIKIGGEGRRSSIYNTIQLNSSYAMAFWAKSGLVELATESGERGLRLPRSRMGAVRTLIEKMGREGEYIDFKNKMDWMAFYGDPAKLPTRDAARKYYEDRSDVDQAVEVQKKIGLAPKKLREYRSVQIKERYLEDVLESNLDRLEAGLRLVGRQYSTLVGPIDLLARDQAGNYVVIELKRGRSSDRVVGQILRYLSWVQSNLARGPKVRGIIVCHSADKNLQAELNGLKYDVKVHVFDMRLAIRELGAAAQ